MKREMIESDVPTMERDAPILGTTSVKMIAISPFFQLVPRSQLCHLS